jgi:hypothetical protein
MHHDARAPSFEPPVQQLDKFDVVGQRVDGGVDLVVVCSGPLDESAATLQALNQKIVAYLDTCAHPNFSRTYPAALKGPVRIFVSCKYAVWTSQDLVDTSSSGSFKFLRAYAAQMTMAAGWIVERVDVISYLGLRELSSSIDLFLDPFFL